MNLFKCPSTSSEKKKMMWEPITGLNVFVKADKPSAAREQ